MLKTILAALLTFGAVAGPATAQPPEAAAPAAVSDPSAPPAAAAGPVPATPVEPPAQPAAGPGTPAAEATGPTIAYIVRDVQPQLIDSTPSRAAFGLIGSLAMISAGADIVKKNNILNPANDIAHDLAAAYAASHGYKLAHEPLSVDKDHPIPKSQKDLAQFAQGARYIVDVEPPGMNLIYQAFGWTSFDLMYLDSARVIDVQTGRVVDKARCFLKSQKRPNQLTHDQLLADEASGLKLLIKAKATECTTVIETELKLPVDNAVVADSSPPLPPPARP